MSASGWRRHARAALLAAGGGLLWALCFGVEPRPWLAWVAVAPLILLLGERRALAWSAVWGTVFWLGSMPWIDEVLRTHGGLPWPLARFAQLLLAAFLGLEQMTFVALGRRLWRRGGAYALAGLPALWVVLESLRGICFGGFPWNLAAYAWTEQPGALPLAAWVGVFGVSFLLVAVNVGVALAWTRRRWDLAATTAMLGFLVLVAAGRWSEPEPPERGRGREVVVIQPDSPIVAPGPAARRNFDELVAMTEEACPETRALGRPARKLLIWPESAAFPMSYGTSPELRYLVARWNARGCDLLLGTVTREDDKYFNSAIVVAEEGIVGGYAKRKLVPWGEYVPLRGVLPFMNRVARAAGDFSPGRSPGVLEWGGERPALAICYEVTFPLLVADQVARGASVLVTITNDAWYGDSSAPHQHFRAARFRAAENRRPLVRAALTGISALVDARGMVDEAHVLGVGERGILRGRLAGARETSPFTRAPYLVPAASIAVAAFAIIAAGRRPRRPEPARPEDQRR